jgi:hypothetical protein
VKFLQNKLLLIGSGKWPEKIESVIAGQDVSLDIVRIPARKFLHLDSRSVKRLLDNRLVWIATIPGNQIQILYSLKEFENKVIIQYWPTVEVARISCMFLSHGDTATNGRLKN